MILSKELYENRGFFQQVYLYIKAGIRTFLKVVTRHKTFLNPNTENSHMRGLPYLTIKEDQSLRCTSCRLCQQYCPTKCIHIESDHGTLPSDEGPPDLFQINILSCIFCGLCVEACPVDAIRMSTEHLLSDRAKSNWEWGQNILAFRSSLNGKKGIISSVSDKQRQEIIKTGNN